MAPRAPDADGRPPPGRARGPAPLSGWPDEGALVRSAGTPTATRPAARASGRRPRPEGHASAGRRASSMGAPRSGTDSHPAGRGPASSRVQRIEGERAARRDPGRLGSDPPTGIPRPWPPGDSGRALHRARDPGDMAIREGDADPPLPVSSRPLEAHVTAPAEQPAARRSSPGLPKDCQRAVFAGHPEFLLTP